MYIKNRKQKCHAESLLLSILALYHNQAAEIAGLAGDDTLGNDSCFYRSGASPTKSGIKKPPRKGAVFKTYQ